MTKDSTLVGDKTKRVFWVFLFVSLAVLAWSTRYWLSAKFGLYEDDLTFIPDAIEADFGTIIQNISGYISSLAQQGRPLMWSWVILFSHLGWQLGGLQGMYVIAYLVWMLNIFLFVLVLQRIHQPFIFSAVGGLAYVLFSADTNQAFLFNAYGLQTALTFFLIAIHCYISKGKLRWFSYLFLVLVMLNYETPYWLFLAAPLLTEANGRDLKKRLIINTLVMTFIFFAIYFMRLLVGESRVSSLGFQEMILTPLKHMAIGPFVGIGIYFLRPFQVFRNLSFELVLATLFCAVIAFFLLFWGSRKIARSSISLNPFKKDWWADLDDGTQRELRLFAAGIVMLVLAYPLTIILRPYAISGRETRVHLAAVVGASLIWASLMTLAIRKVKTKGWRLGLLILVSLLFGLNFAFGFLIQYSYQRAWSLQKSFWSELLPMISDVDSGTAVLVEPTGLEDTLYINANTWVLPRMLERLFVFPESWVALPRVYRLVPLWETNILRIQGYFTLDGSNVFGHMIVFGDYQQDETIFISTANGELERLEEINIQEQTIILKSVGQNRLSNLETRPLFDLMGLSELTESRQ